MLEELFGSKSVARILLFLFVNEACYGAQIQSVLQIPLTPIQKALQRLERNKILTSSSEGKLRIYRFDPSYPLRDELEMLLKKAYGFLSLKEKKDYCFIHDLKFFSDQGKLTHREKIEELQNFWKVLTRIKQLSFSAKSRNGEVQITKIGKADVHITSLSSSICVYEEKGYWFRNGIPETSFNSSFRWTLDLQTCLISLEHLRYGFAHPVFLFHLTPTKPFVLEAVDAHLCAADCYLGSILWDSSSIHFHWRIIGPSKNDELIYQYT